jgi:hypothetical protein
MLKVPPIEIAENLNKNTIGMAIQMSFQKYFQALYTTEPVTMATLIAYSFQ